MKMPSCLFWDYNGTLIDDVGVSLNSVNDMLKKRNMNCITLEQYRSYIDTPISKFYEHLFNLDEVPFDLISYEFLLGYEKYIGENPVMCGAKELLSYFSDFGCFQAIISGSRQGIIEDGIKRYGLFNYFDLISGSSDHYVKSKVKRAEEIAKNHCKICDDILVIGDCVQDFEVSEALGANCILLSAGHQSREDLQRTGAVVVDKLTDVMNILY